MSRKAISEIVNGRSGISPDMAMRFELALGKSAESWLAHQAAFDLWQVESKKDTLGVRAIPMVA